MGSEIKPDAENQAFQSNKPTQHFQSNGGIQSIFKKNSIEISKKLSFNASKVRFL